MMKSLQKCCAALLAAVGCLAVSTAQAYEYSGWVKVNNFFAFSNTSSSLYYVYADGPWGFTNCSSTVNANFITFSSADPSAKTWVATLLLAKATGATVQVTLADCSTGVVAQIGIK